MCLFVRHFEFIIKCNSIEISKFHNNYIVLREHIKEREKLNLRIYEKERFHYIKRNKWKVNLSFKETHPYCFRRF